MCVCVRSPVCTVFAPVLLALVGRLTGRHALCLCWPLTFLRERVSWMPWNAAVCSLVCLLVCAAKTDRKLWQIKFIYTHGLRGTVGRRSHAANTNTRNVSELGLTCGSVCVCVSVEAGFVWKMCVLVDHTCTRTRTKPTREYEHLNKFGLHFRNLTVHVKQERGPQCGVELASV